MANDSPSKFTAAYASWRTFDNLIGRMAEDGGVPGRVDRSYLSNLPGSAQSEIQTTLKSLGLIDDGFHPTVLLEELVEGTNNGTAAATMLTILESHYSNVLALERNATQAQLMDAFRDLNVNGSTLRKAIRFFLGAAEFAGLELSPHFTAPKAEPSARRPRVRRTKPAITKNATGENAANHPPARDLGHSHLHPFIKGLVEALPEPGTYFSPDKQDAWFDTARGIFRLIYAPSAEREKEGAIFLDLSDAAASEEQEEDDA